MEQSHGKARPALPRSKDVHLVRTERDPSAGRGANGRFGAGNRLSVGAGEKNAVKKLLGRHGSAGDAATIVRDAMRVFRGALRDLPSDGPIVRGLAGLYSRHIAVSAFFTSRADEAGLDDPGGQALLEIALRHGVRAERLAVTMTDLATKYAARQDRDPGGAPWLDAEGGPG